MPSKIQKLEVSMKLSKILKLLVILMVFAVGQNTWAQGFSIGGGLGLPSLLEVRVGYETNDFGVRSYLNLIGLWGADIYARVSVPNPNVTYRIGIGVVFNKDVEVGFRGLVGIAWSLTPNIVLTYELRPMYFPSLWSDTSTTNELFLFNAFAKAIGQLFSLVSMSLTLEYHF
jgi:hypothetical protein